MLILLCMVLATSVCPVIREPNAEFRVKQSECFAGGSLFSRDGDEFLRPPGMICHPHYANGHMWEAAYPSIVSLRPGSSPFFPSIRSKQNLDETSFNFFRLDRPLNLTVEYRFIYHSPLVYTGLNPSTQQVNVIQVPLSIIDFAFNWLEVGIGFDVYIRGFSSGFSVTRFFGNAYDQISPVGSSIELWQFIRTTIRWNDHVRLLYTIEFIDHLDSFRICMYIHFRSIVYQQCRFEPANGVKLTRGINDPRYETSKGPIRMFADVSTSAAFSPNITITSLSMWDIALDVPTILTRLNQSIDAVPVGRNATLKLPQGGGFVDLSLYSLDTDGEPVVRFQIDSLPVRGTLYSNGVPVGLGIFPNVTYIPTNPFDSNLPTQASPCNTPYDTFRWRPYTAPNASEQSPGPYTSTLSLCLYDVLDTATALNQTIFYRKGTLAPFTVTWFDPDDLVASLDTTYIEAYLIDPPSFIVDCATLLPPGRLVNGQGACLYEVESYDEYMVEVGVGVSETVGGVGGNATLTIYLTSPVVAPNQVLNMTENEPTAFILNWTDTLGLETLELVLSDPWVSLLSNREIEVNPPQDYFNVWSLGPRPPKLIPYSIVLGDQLLAHGMLDLRVQSVPSPIRVRPYFIPSQSSPDILEAKLLDIIDPDEDEFTLLVNGLFTEGTNSKLFFPNFTRAIRAQVEIDECEDWQFRGCSTFRIRANASTVNHIMSSVRFEFPDTLTEAVLVVEVGRDLDFRLNSTFTLPGVPSSSTSVTDTVLRGIGLAMGAIALGFAAFVLTLALGYKFFEWIAFTVSRCITYPCRRQWIRIRRGYVQI